MSRSSLEHGQKVFNQRLLAEHCMTEKDIRIVWNELYTRDQHSMGGRTLEETIASCNESLKYIGLEIVGVLLPDADVRRETNDDEDDMSDEENNPRNHNNRIRNQRGGTKKTNGLKKSSTMNRYYGIINRFSDDISKQCFQHLFLPHEQAYVRLIFDKLVENSGPILRSTLLNFKNLLNNDGNNNNSSRRISSQSQRLTQNTQNDESINVSTSPVLTTLTLPMVEDIVDRLISEKWLVMKHENSPTTTNSQQQPRRSSLNGCGIDIGPRSYMELSYLLVNEFGMNKEDLPQQIYHRI